MMPVSGLVDWVVEPPYIALREGQYVIRCGQQIVVHYLLHPTECACHVTVSTTGTVRTATGKLG